MATGIDHIVITVDNLDQTTADYTAAGFTVTDGGEHKGGASANVLVTFQDGAYFELIAFKGQGGGAPGWRDALETSGEGLVDYALRTDDLPAEIDALTNAGLDVEGPYPGGRFRPDGQRIDWQIIRFNNEDKTTSLPFYCVDETERSLRVPNGQASVHANGVTGVKILRVVVRDIEAATTEYARLTGSEGQDVAPAHPGIAVARQFPVGNTVIEIVQPAAGENRFSTYLAQRGEKPVEVVLQGASGSGTTLPVDQTHGAQLVIQG